MQLREEYDAKKAPHYKARFEVVAGANTDEEGVPGFWLQVIATPLPLSPSRTWDARFSVMVFRCFKTT